MPCAGPVPPWQTNASQGEPRAGHTPVGPSHPLPAARLRTPAGMHLCGALSPRLIALASSIERVDAFAVCPCCIKGSLGHLVKRTARQLGRSNYEVLVEALGDMCARELALPNALDGPADGQRQRGEQGHTDGDEPEEEEEEARGDARHEAYDAVRLCVDEHMCSPRNRFVSVVKRPVGTPSLCRTPTERRGAACS